MGTSEDSVKGQDRGEALEEEAGQADLHADLKVWGALPPGGGRCLLAMSCFPKRPPPTSPAQTRVP